MVKSEPHQQIGYILRSYPRLSQTFILNEILALEQAGVSIEIFAITRPEEELVQPQVQQIQARVRYLDSAASGGYAKMLQKNLWEHLRALLRSPVRYLLALWYVLRSREIDLGYTASSRLHCFHLAVVLARLLRQGTVTHLHAHFAHDPTLIAQLVHRMTGLPFSFTTHARDLFQVRAGVLRERIRQAQAVVTCCRNNLEYLCQVAPAERAKFHMIYHGVDIRDFTPTREVQTPLEPPLILSVGRLVEKKGFSDLLCALERVKKQGLRFRCLIYGDGPLRPQLQQWIDEHCLADCITLAGTCSQQQLIPVFQSAALFALTPRVTGDGDRDGIPNVLVEAMATGIPVVSTSAAGIPELVIDGQNGLLSPPGDIQCIAAGITQLLNDPARRAAFGRSARSRVVDHFSLPQSAVRLQELFTAASPSPLPLSHNHPFTGLT